MSCLRVACSDAQPSDFRLGFMAVLADRHGPEARALFVTLSRYVERRVRTFWRIRAIDILGESEIDELVGEVLFQLMAGSLAQFRGETLPELLAFVRTVTDRCLWRVARRRLEERNALESSAEMFAARVHDRADDIVLLAAQTPIDENDRRYLEELFRVGSKAAFARKVGVSRAAVTKRVDRIRQRIAALSPSERQAAEAWLHHAARVAVNR